MNAQPTRRLRVAWIDPIGESNATEAGFLIDWGLDLRVVREPRQILSELVHLRALVVRLGHDMSVLEECISLARLPGRRLPVICRVAPQQLAIAVQAMKLGADHVLSTLDRGGPDWAVALGLTEDRAERLVSPLPPDLPRPSEGCGGPISTRRSSAYDAARSAVFVDPVSQQLLALARRVAQAEVSVLLTGPTGAGKEIMARVLHEASPRRDGPFVSLNCGALPENLIEDLLFGHEKGAFSGAIREHPGIFEQADGGTVFLDEIGEMPPHLQTRLLRVLQERCVVRLGGTRSLSVNVRLVAATNRDLKQAMQRREFREDLFFRISTFTLRLLPLIDRPGDILPLAAHFLQQYAAAGPPYRITEDARHCLMSYRWPGNVRELGNVIQRALVICPGRLLAREHLLFDDDVFAPGVADHAISDATGMHPPLEAGQGSASARTAPRATSVPEGEAVHPGAVQGGSGGLQWAVRHSELQVIENAIRNSPSREAAARMLGISPRTLRYKLAQMRDMGMPTPVPAN